MLNVFSIVKAHLKPLKTRFWIQFKDFVLFREAVLDNINIEHVNEL